MVGLGGTPDVCSEVVWIGWRVTSDSDLCLADLLNIEDWLVIVNESKLEVFETWLIGSTWDAFSVYLIVFGKTIQTLILDCGKRLLLITSETLRQPVWEIKLTRRALSKRRSQQMLFTGEPGILIVCRGRLRIVMIVLL